MDTQQIETLIQKEARIKELQTLIFDSQVELNTVTSESLDLQGILNPLIEFGKSYSYVSSDTNTYLFTRHPSGVYVTLADELELPSP
jgi:hypothetical protein